MNETKNFKILVADDQEGMRESLAGIFELEGFEVHAFEDGYKAIEKAKETTFDVAFLDIKMPGINGVETFLELKKISPETIVFMMTAYANDELISKAIEEGAYTCLYKPLNLESIMKFLQIIQNGEKILIIDKQDASNHLIKSELIKKGYNTTLISNGLEAVKSIYRKLPDTIIINLSEAQTGGVGTLKDIKKICSKKMPNIIVIDSDQTNENVKTAFELGTVKFLLKPITFSSVEKCIGELKDSISKQLSILIVDDDASFGKSLYDVLMNSDYDVQLASTGLQALEKIQKENFSVILLDIKLPDINGIDLYYKINELKPRSKILMMTAYPNDESVSNAINNGNFTCLYKPFDPNEMLNLIKKNTK